MHHQKGPITDTYTTDWNLREGEYKTTDWNLREGEYKRKLGE
jgi:hypothetical protein